MPVVCSDKGIKGEHASESISDALGRLATSLTEDAVHDAQRVELPLGAVRWRDFALQIRLLDVEAFGGELGGVNELFTGIASQEIPRHEANVGVRPLSSVKPDQATSRNPQGQRLAGAGDEVLGDAFSRTFPARPLRDVGVLEGDLLRHGDEHLGSIAADGDALYPPAEKRALQLGHGSEIHVLDEERLGARRAKLSLPDPLHGRLTVCLKRAATSP